MYIMRHLFFMLKFDVQIVSPTDFPLNDRRPVYPKRGKTA